MGKDLIEFLEDRKENILFRIQLSIVLENLIVQIIKWSLKPLVNFYSSEEVINPMAK